MPMEVVRTVKWPHPTITGTVRVYVAPSQQLDADGKADARFDVVDLELGALRVLHGMLSSFSQVVFGRALIDEEKERLEREIRAWVALVQAGYPEEGDPPGSSARGPVTARYDDRQTLRLHAEVFLASDACLESLEALVVRWSSEIRVVSLETE